MGRVVQIDLCPDEGFVLSIGPISLWLSAATALDVVETLARALVLEAARTSASPAWRDASKR